MEAGWLWNCSVQSRKRLNSLLQQQMAIHHGNIKHFKSDLIGVKDTYSISVNTDDGSGLYEPRAVLWIQQWHWHSNKTALTLWLICSYAIDTVEVNMEQEIGSGGFKRNEIFNCGCVWPFLLKICDLETVYWLDLQCFLASRHLWK